MVRGSFLPELWVHKAKCPHTSRTVYSDKLRGSGWGLEERELFCRVVPRLQLKARRRGRVGGGGGDAKGPLPFDLSDNKMAGARRRGGDGEEEGTERRWSASQEKANA